MKKTIVLLGACLILLSGCGTKIPTLENGQEAVVTFKGNQKISVDDLYKEIKDIYALSSLINMIDTYILEEEYKDEVEELKEEAKLTRESLITQFGSEESATNAIQQYMGMSTLDAYEQYIYLGQLQSLAVTDYAKAQITDKQVEKHYKNEVVPDIKVSHILIVPDVTDDMSDDDKKKAEENAEKKVKDLIKTLQDTKAKDVQGKFAELAKENSHDTATSNDGGNMGYINKTTLSSSYKDFATEAYKLKDGEFTTNVVKSELGYHIILRVETKEKAKLETLKDSIIEELANNLISNDNTVSINALRELRKKYDMEIVDSELQKQYTNYIQNSLTQAQSSSE